MRHNPERLAWTILLIAVVFNCVLAIGFPLSVRSYLLSARRPLYAQTSVQRGTVRVERGGNGGVDAIGLDDPAPLQLFKGDGIRTGERDEGLLALQSSEDENRETLTSVVVYDNSNVILSDAYSPRFGLSAGPHEAILRLERGRARIEVQPADDGRSVRIQVRTDHARILLSEGSYALEATDQQTITTVRSGEATVHAGDEKLTLTSEERAVASLSGVLAGPLPAERNLIANGDFSQGLNVGWATIPDSADGTARVTSATADDGQSVAHFQHDEPQPSEVGLIQTLNRNVTDLQSLVLHLKVRVDYHSLSVCGSLGSECPVMVRVDYIDTVGSGRQWVHGFYALEDPSITLPYYCTTCPDPSSGNHSQVPEKSWFLYDSPNLMELLPVESRPVTVRSVRVYASGHSYNSLVTDVELLAQE